MTRSLLGGWLGVAPDGLSGDEIKGRIINERGAMVLAADIHWRSDIDGRVAVRHVGNERYKADNKDPRS